MRSQISIVREAKTGTISEKIVMAVAEATDVDPLDLDPPLYEVIDPDAIDRLFRRRDRGGRVEFTMAGCRVIIRSDGRVGVIPQIDTDAEDSFTTASGETVRG